MRDIHSFDRHLLVLPGPDGEANEYINCILPERAVEKGKRDKK